VRRSLPELPAQRVERYQREHGLSAVDADILVADRAIADYFDATVSASGNARAAANWIRNDVLRVQNEGRDYKLAPEGLGKLIKLIDSGAIGSKAAKEVFEEITASGEDPQRVVERKGLAQVSDPAVIRDAAQRVLERNKAQVEQYRAGKTQVFGFLVGQLMKETRGKAKAELANEILLELLAR